MRISGKLAILLGVFMVSATTAFGITITSIGVLTPAAGDTPASGVTAISPDGSYAVGYSNVADGAVTVQRPIVWTGGTLYQLPAMDALSTTQSGTGVVVRPIAGTIAIVGGFLQTANPFKVQMKTYAAPLGDLANGSWTDNGRGIAGITAPYNAGRIKTAAPGEPWYAVGTRSGSNRDMVQGMDGAASLDHRNGTAPQVVSNSVAGNAHTAGYDTGGPSGARRALWMNANNGTTQTVIPGGSGVASEAFGISVGDNILSGYDATDATHNQAFIWKPGDAAMTLLGTLPGDTQSTGIAVNLIGGNWITAGYSSDGTTERAAIWDQTGTWDATGQPKLLTDILTGAGVDISAWSSLTRVTSMSDDGQTLAGHGVWADGTTRGFIVAIPEPTAMLLLAVGAFAALRRRPV